MTDELPWLLLSQIFTMEDIVDIGGRYFATGFIRDSLDGATELDLQPTRQCQTVFLFQEIRHTALARLAVHTNDGIVAAADIGWVDRQVRYFPRCVGFLLSEAFFDGVLVRARERRKDQVARIGMPRMYGQLIAVLHATTHFVDVGKVQTGMDALRVEVQRQCYQADVARTLAV